MLLSLAGILVMAVWRTRSPLMTVYMVSLAAFARASLAFLLATPWNHLWWLGHGIFAAGFFMLSYGIVQAFHTTRSFSTIYSQMDMMAQLREQQAWTQEALLHVTVSVGCAQLGPDGADMKSLTHTADERLYQAKALGRNRVVIA